MSDSNLVKRLKSIEKIARIGSYEFFIQQNYWVSSEVLDNVFGIDSTYAKTFENWALLIHPEDQELMSNYFIEEVLGKKKSFNKEYRIINQITKDVIWVHGMGEVVWENQIPIKMFGTIQDIHDRKIKQILLNESEYKLRTLFNTMAQGVIYHDLSGNVIDANPAAELIFGLNKNEMSLFSVNDSLKYICNINSSNIIYDEHPVVKVINTKKSQKNIVLGIRNKKRIVSKWIKLSAIPEFYDNKLFRVFTTFEDITDLENTRIELIKAKEEAEISEKLKSAFLANMSHEIRTPMNGIIGFASLLAEEEVSEEKRQKFAKIIVESGDHLMNIINDIIDLSKIDSGLMNISEKDFNLSILLNEVYDFFTNYMDKSKTNNIKFLLNQEILNLQIYADDLRLKQILINLIGNAFKFTDSGIIEFGFNIREQNLVFYVKDTGIGISKEKQSIIFDRFKQASNTLDRIYGGTGLGLSIAKSFVEMMKGTISVESEENQGSTFYFNIPLVKSN